MSSVCDNGLSISHDQYAICAGSGWAYQGGTMPYTAPEVLRPSGNVLPFTHCSPPVDCWALGVTALELLTGCCLFKVDKKARPSEVVSGTEDCDTWEWSYTAGLHKQWVRSNFLHPLQIGLWSKSMPMLSLHALCGSHCRW
jgi:serine/threonine protein kinase